MSRRKDVRKSPPRWSSGTGGPVAHQASVQQSGLPVTAQEREGWSTGLLRRLSRAPRSYARRRFGLWRVMEWRNKAFGFPWALVWLRRERRLAGYALESLGEVPAARVAVIIPTFRRGEQLRLAVQSALDQTVADIVVMVVDDGGDETSGLPRDPRLRVVSLPRNTGLVGIVRNVGIRATRSDYLAFLDDDNTWTPDHLSRTLTALDGGVGLAYSNVARRRRDGSLLDTLAGDFDRRRLAEVSYIDMNSVVVKRSRSTWFSRVPRGRSVLPREDWEFAYRLSGSAPVKHVPWTTVNYLVNEHSYYTDWTEG